MTHEELYPRLRALLTSPLTMREILLGLKVGAAERLAVQRGIRDLTRDGRIVSIRGGRFGLADEMNLVTGVVQGHPDRFGFLIIDDPNEADVYLGPRNFEEAMHGDKVVVRLEKTRSDGRREGNVIRILERANDTLTGTFRPFRGGGFVTPFDRKIVHDVFVDAADAAGAKDGDAVVVKMLDYPGKATRAVGSIDRVLGKADDPTVEIEIVIAKHRLRNKFPTAAVAQAKACRPPAEADLKGRQDFRSRPIVTIDGETAKDFDDAVEVTRTKDGGYELGVHIADVSHYVTEDSALDKEAALRATSVYFPGSVIPMLPFELSNDLCSLNPKVDRLTMSCVMTFDAEGNQIGYKLSESVIRSFERMTYTDVAAVIDRTNPDTLKRYAALVERFDLMGELAALLRKQRFRAGAIDFDLPEPEIVLDVTGKPEDIVVAKRNVAHRLIEEFMLAANRSVALHFLRSRHPAIYRIHDEPDPLKIEAFKEFIDSFGYRFPAAKKIDAVTMQKVISDFVGRPEERLITTVLLRSMKQARYAVDNIGHFGLAFDHYTHFTSPIRRYPDLIVHRLIKDLLRKTRRAEHWAERLPNYAAHCSGAERVADDAEREVVKLRQTQYLAERVGETFDGVISGVTAFGFFVELLHAPVEGLVRLTSLTDDYYQYDQVGHSLVGRRRNRRFRLGDPVTILVEHVSIERRQVDFVIVGEGGTVAPRLAKEERPARKASLKAKNARSAKGRQERSSAKAAKKAANPTKKRRPR
ncbi:MAG: ribonuclease R [Nitrospinae bacterium]|nr:ribonuclease R [Nitrospinota bacterium]